MESGEERSSISSDKPKPNYAGPVPGVKYPLNVLYCGECNLPLDLCEYSPNPEACKEWLNKNHPNLNEKLENLNIQESNSEGGAAAADDGEKKSSHQKRGGKAMPKSKKEKQPSKVIVSKDKRKGNKYVTIISGLEGNDVDIEVAKKFFASKFCCGCSKGDNNELIIQGDFVDQLFNVIPEKFPQITEDMIEEKEK